MSNRAAAAAAQGEIEVIPEPLRQADVPPVPEVAGAGGEIRQVEVERQLKTQAPGHPAGHVGVSGKVAVDLKSEGINRQQYQTAVERFPAAEEIFHDQAQIVGDHHFLEQAPEDQVDPLVKLRQVESAPASDLGQQASSPA